MKRPRAFIGMQESKLSHAKKSAFYATMFFFIIGVSLGRDVGGVQICNRLQVQLFPILKISTEDLNYALLNNNQ